MSSRDLVSIDNVAAAIIAAVAGKLSACVVNIDEPMNATDREVAAPCALLSGRLVKVISLPPALIAAIALAMGPLHAGARSLLLFGEQNRKHGNLVADASHTKAIIGREPIPLDGFANAQTAKLR